MRVTVSDIPNGLPGTLETLRAMFRAIKRSQLDGTLVQFTRAAVGNLDFRQERQIINAITDAWARTVRIIEDPIAADWLQDAEVTLQQRRGDCDDLVIGLGASLESVGFPIELIVGSLRPGGANDMSHVWLRVWMPIARQWLSIDPRGIIDKRIGFRIGQELRPESLTAVGAYGYDADRGVLTDGISVPSKAKPRRRNFILSRVRGTPAQRARMVGVGAVDTGCINLGPTGLGTMNPNAPVERFITTGFATAQGQTVQPVVNVAGTVLPPGATVQQRVVQLQKRSQQLQQAQAAQVVGPTAVDKAEKATNIQKRLSPFLAATGIAAALTSIVTNLRK